MNPFEESSNEAFWPELYTDACPSQNCWAERKRQFLWTSWSKIESYFGKEKPLWAGQDSYFAHATRADSCRDLVRAKTSSSRERHNLLADSIPEGQRPSGEITG
jgi:hypothetical protein